MRKLTAKVVWDILHEHGEMSATQLSKLVGEFGKDWELPAGTYYSPAGILACLARSGHVKKAFTVSYGEVFQGYTYRAVGKGPSRSYNRRHGQGELVSKILRTLENGPLNTRSISGILGVDAKDISRTLHTLVKNRVVVKDTTAGQRKGVYSYTPPEPSTEEVGGKVFHREEIGPTIKRLTARAKRDLCIPPKEYK